MTKSLSSVGIILIGLLLLSACDSNRLYEKNLAIDKSEWHRSEKALFEFEVKDTSARYNILLNFRHSGNYSYKNLYLFTKTKSPTGKIAIDTAQMVFADEKGHWMGKGIGDIYDYQFKFKKGVTFPDSGNYQFEIEQAMRDEVLPNVTDIGLRIEKVEP
jgi:gliding motility-associated lipoprotein GldH